MLKEFDAIAARGGVLGAMETGYQRGKIQDESLYLRAQEARRLLSDHRREHLPQPARRGGAREHRARALERGGEAVAARAACANFRRATPPLRRAALERLRRAVIENGNTFEVLMEAVRSCSLGQITGTLYEVGGRYRRNM